MMEIRGHTIVGIQDQRRLLARFRTEPVLPASFVKYSRFADSMRR